MRRIPSFALFMGIILVLASCTESLPRRFESFVSAVESDCSVLSYAEEYWMEKDSRFNKLFIQTLGKEWLRYKLRDGDWKVLPILTETQHFGSEKVSYPGSKADIGTDKV